MTAQAIPGAFTLLCLLLVAAAFLGLVVEDYRKLRDEYKRRGIK